MNLISLFEKVYIFLIQRSAERMKRKSYHRGIQSKKGKGWVGWVKIFLADVIFRQRSSVSHKLGEKTTDALNGQPLFILCE